MKALLEIFYQPGALFADLPNRKHAWVIPVIADAILVILITMLAGHYIGWENIIRRQLQGWNMAPDDMEKAMAAALSPAGIYRTYIFAGLGAPIVLAAISGALLIFSMMTSRQQKFGTMFSMVSIAYFPYYLISGIMTALILSISPDPASMDPRNVVATNIGAYMDKESMSKGMYALLTSMDLLSFVEISLLAYGFSKLTKSSFFGGFGAVMVLWVMYVACKMALTSIFG